MTQRFRLIQDEDCHWYIIQPGDEDKFYAWEKAMTDCEQPPDGWEPIRVDGPHRMTFTDWKEE